MNYAFKNTNGVSWGLVHTIVTADVTPTTEVIKLTVTNGCTVNGNVTVTLRGGTPVVIAVTTAADLATEVATLIQAGTFTGWVATVDGAVVTFTAVAGGIKTGANTVAVASTGVVATIAVTTTGSNETMKFVTPVSDTDMAFIAQFTSATGALVSFTGTMIVEKPSAGADFATLSIIDNDTPSLVAGSVVTVIANKVYKF